MALVCGAVVRSTLNSRRVDAYLAYLSWSAGLSQPADCRSRHYRPARGIVGLQEPSELLHLLWVPRLAAPISVFLRHVPPPRRFGSD